jgi:hypothetical protein
MRKLKLDIDHLEVDSFETDVGHDQRGTVHGLVSPYCTQTCDTANNYSCDGAYTCGAESTCRRINTCMYESCGACGTYDCVSAGYSCDQMSCVYTCAVACSEGSTYSCTPGQCP